MPARDLHCSAMVGGPVRSIPQHRSTRPFLLTLVAALLGAAALALPAPAAASRPLYTGMSGVYDYVPLAYEQVRATGASFVRIGVPWGSIAPKEQPAQWQPTEPGDPNYHWGYVDGAVENAVAARLTPVLMVNSVPSWAEGCNAPPGYSEASCKPDAGALAQFATALARRFSGNFGGLPRVTYWQGLNEPNLSLYFLPQYEGETPVSANLYRPIANAFYAAIKAVDPSNLVLAAGLGPNYVPRYTIGPLQFARELLCMTGGKKPKPKPGDCGGGVSFDIFDIHPYTSGGPTHEGGPTDVELGDLSQLQELLQAAERSGRIHGSLRHVQLWVDEFSWDSNPPDPNGLALKIETRWTAEALYRAWQAGVEHFFWYGLRDEPLIPGQPSSFTTQSGLYFRGDTLAADKPKPALYAFRFPFVAYPESGRLTVWGRSPTSSAGKVRVQLKRGKGWRTVKTLRAGSNGVFQARIPTSYGSGRKGAARAVFGGTRSTPFSMRPVPDFEQPPFG
jgi:hypothetical protein